MDVNDWQIHNHENGEKQCVVYQQPSRNMLALLVGGTLHRF